MNAEAPAAASRGVRGEAQCGLGGREGLHARGRAHDTMLVVPGLVGSGIIRALARRRNGRPSMVESRQPLVWKWRTSGVLCLGAAAKTVRRPSGLGSYDGRAEKHGCGCNGFAAGSWVDEACDACDAEHVQTEPGACYAKSVLQEEGGAKFLAQEIEDIEDELIAGTGEDARQQQQQQQQGQRGRTRAVQSSG